MMKSFTVALVSALIGICAAIPTPQSLPSGANIIRPIARSQYEVWTGAVQYKTPTGKIFKNGQTTDITTLLTFDLPTSIKGFTCEFHFFLDPTAAVEGTGQFDVFTSLAPATQDTTTWPSGNLRDQYAGRMAASLPGEATWVAGFPSEGRSFPCPGGQLMAGELVPTGETDDIEWDGSVAGAYMLYY